MFTVHRFIHIRELLPLFEAIESSQDRDLWRAEKKELQVNIEKVVVAEWRSPAKHSLFRRVAKRVVLLFPPIRALYQQVLLANARSALHEAELRRREGERAAVEPPLAAAPLSTTPAKPEPLPATAAMTAAATDRMRRLYERMADSSNLEMTLGFRREHTPVLVDLNGDLIWLPSDLLRFLWHTHQQAEPAFIPHFLAETPHYLWIRDRLQTGDTVLDCGANLGLFTTMMAERVGSIGAVHAFEPSPGARSDLERVLRLNQLTWVVVNPCAVAEFCGEAVFCDITETDVRREGSHLQSSNRSTFTKSLARRELRVPVTTLDNYVIERAVRPRLVKIDVEGAEFEVLEGGRNCVRDFRPLLAIEIHADASGNFDHARLRRYLDEYEYHYDCQDKTYLCEPASSHALASVRSTSTRPVQNEIRTEQKQLQVNIEKVVVSEWPSPAKHSLFRRVAKRVVLLFPPIRALYQQVLPCKCA